MQSCRQGMRLACACHNCAIEARHEMLPSHDDAPMLLGDVRHNADLPSCAQAWVPDRRRQELQELAAAVEPIDHPPLQEHHAAAKASTDGRRVVAGWPATRPFPKVHVFVPTILLRGLPRAS